MFTNSGYYYKGLPNYESIDTAPAGQVMFIISAGHYKLLTLDFFDTGHPPRNDYQILYVKNGILYYYENGIKKSAGAGSFIFYRPGELQKYIYYLKDHPDIYWVHFSGSSASMLLQSNNLLNSKVVTIGHKKRFEHIFDFMIENLNNLDEYSNSLNTLYLQELIFLIARERQEPISKEKETPEYLKAVQYINDHLSEKITLADIAEHTNVSTKTLTRHFEKYQNTSPMRYVNFTRIEKAKFLLQSNNSIGQIASVLGFEDPLYFSTVFRRYTGLSPEKYRKSFKK